MYSEITAIVWSVLNRLYFWGNVIARSFLCWTKLAWQDETNIWVRTPALLAGKKKNPNNNHLTQT